MSVIYYCDAPSCGKKQQGNSEEHPKGWLACDVEGKLFDACSKNHADRIVEVHTPPPPEPEEEEEAEAEDS